MSGTECISHLESRCNLYPEEKFCSGAWWDGVAVTVRVWCDIEVADDVDGTVFCSGGVNLLDELVKPCMVAC